jgi:hypothetical protein
MMPKERQEERNSVWQVNCDNLEEYFLTARSHEDMRSTVDIVKVMKEEEKRKKRRRER